MHFYFYIRKRRWWVGVMMMLLAGGAVMAQVARLENQRESVLEAMRQRPQDPWPRSQGHVPLALPGTLERRKAYYEPGGSFSPAVGSFGLSIWVTAPDGALRSTSDSLPLPQLRQQLLWTKAAGIPGIEAETIDYKSYWQCLDPARWQMDLSGKGSNRLQVVLRSVGPAGAPLHLAEWKKPRLLLNNRWAVQITARDGGKTSVVEPRFMGEETEAGWRTNRTAITRMGSGDGWGVVRFELGIHERFDLLVEDTKPGKRPYLLPVPTTAWVKAELPEAAFAQCLRAQMAHLEMGLVERETRPADPTHAPLNRLRDGAYILVALARSGQVGTVRELARPFAKQDFFGGFGSEADGPGLSLWALEEVAAQVRDPAFDRWLWPNVKRKAGVILDMLSTTQAMHKAFSGPIVPKYAQRLDIDRVCEAAREGLIVGKMDWQRPVLYVNAVSYRGLLSAAQLAQRVGQGEKANLWRQRAFDLRVAWNSALTNAVYENERNDICGLHPTWIADPTLYLPGLEEQDKKNHTPEGGIQGQPLRTYFTLAQAHQWLFLGQPDRTWKDLRWFWEHQSSPGLFTWWEGPGEENNFGRWEQVKGWVKPPHVTPQYWTAAEMLLLQLDMLAYLDESGSEPVLVLGGGIPKEWTGETLRVEHIGTRLGTVSWSWSGSGKIMEVTWKGSALKFRLGPGFPPAATVQVTR